VQLEHIGYAIADDKYDHVRVAAVASGNVQMLMRLGEPVYTDDPFSVSKIDYLAPTAARHNKIGMLRHLSESMPDSEWWRYRSYLAATIGNHVDVFEHLMDSRSLNNCLDVTQCVEICKIAVEYNSTDVLKYIWPGIKLVVLPHLQRLVNYDKQYDMLDLLNVLLDYGGAH
jgi:hypothetical protein